MKKIKPLNYKLMSKFLDPKVLSFNTTDEMSVEVDFLGQQRALEAIDLGVGIQSQGYNFFVMGASGIGKRSLIRKILKEYAQMQSAPDDWCYIYNFNAPEKPLAVKLSPGYGLMLKRGMDDLLANVKSSILAVYESKEYQIGMQEIADKYNNKRNKKLPDDTHSREITYLCKEKNESEKQLLSSFVKILIEPFIAKLKDDFEDYPKIIAYLQLVESDLLLHVSELVKKDESTQSLMFDKDDNSLLKYQVNLFVNNKLRKGAPVIIEDNPSYSNIISQVENKIQNGTVVTDFTLLRSGALHRANGGFLIVDARKITQEKYVWNSLINALYTGKVIIESIEHITGSAKSIALKPKPIPLKIKIVLVGDRDFYYELARTDPDFNELFKVLVDFDDLIDRNKENIIAYAQLIGSLIKKRNLRPFDRSAVATIIDYSTRLAEDINKLSNYLEIIDEVIRESDYWARSMKKKIVDALSVNRAIESRIHRIDRSRDLYYEEIRRNHILIRVDSVAIGQLNCLSVVRVGNLSYGHPTRVTVKVRAGKGEIIDIQRAVKLAGAIHSKSVLILANYLAGQYSRNSLFSLTASISFEQIYGMIDGDSASVAELCALISALAEVPLNQAIAVTGSINQEGEVQAVGSVNEKIEGYFDVCKAQGLTGKQGVIIPASNVQNLMLRKDVVQASKAKQFFIYPISVIDEAVTLLTGMNAGTMNAKGQFPKNSVNAKVEARLRAFSDHRFKRRHSISSSVE